MLWGCADMSYNLSGRPWVEAVTTDAALEASQKHEKLRPLIYVYDLPATFNVRMLEYRIVKVRALFKPLHYLCNDIMSQLCLLRA